MWDMSANWVSCGVLKVAGAVKYLARPMIKPTMAKTCRINAAMLENEKSGRRNSLRVCWRICMTSSSRCRSSCDVLVGAAAGEGAGGASICFFGAGGGLGGGFGGGGGGVP